MTDRTAGQEYCTHCGRELGSVRTIIVGSNAALHPDCVAGWQAKGAPKAAPKAAGRTSVKGWWDTHEHYDRNGYCDNPGRGY